MRLVRIFLRRHLGGMQKPVWNICMALWIVTTAASCSTQKFLQPGQSVLNSNMIEVELTPELSASANEISGVLKDSKNFYSQIPNSRFLGLFRFSMRMYCLSSPADSNWVNRYLRKQGEAPVVYDEGLALRTAEQLRGMMESKGCFRSQVTFDTVRWKKNEVRVVYHVKPQHRYRIREVNYAAETEEVHRFMQSMHESSLLRVGDFYSQDAIVSERSRIAQLLQNAGYYRANESLLTVRVDTSFLSNELRIDVLVHDPVVQERDNEGIHSISLQKYRIGNVYIQPINTSIRQEKIGFDTLLYPYKLRSRIVDYRFVFNGAMDMKPQTVVRNLFLFPGATYRPRMAQQTYNSLLSLRTFKYVDVEFVESPRSCDTLPLVDAKLRLISLPKHRLSTSLELNNASPFGSQQLGFWGGNLGLETGVEYQNKNLFGGAELLKVKGSLLFELPMLVFRDTTFNEFRDYFSSFDAGLEVSLDLPAFLAPFAKNIVWQRVKPHTQFSLGANYQYKSYFERVLSNASFGYLWSRNSKVQHRLTPVELTYVRFLSVDSAFMSRILGFSDARLKYQYSDHFIMDLKYELLYSSQQYNERSNFSYVLLMAESAGNVLDVVSRLTGVGVDENGVRRILGVPYSQYVRFSAEGKRYFYYGAKSVFVARMLLGVGVPYSNSISLPYEKSFFGGGPTTIRAWQLRHLGPGTYSTVGTIDVERTGDLTLVLNMENRFPLFSIFEGAVFFDAGNVWLFRNSEEYPGGEFSLKTLPQSLALGGGLGVRINASIITVRLDFAIPFYDPGQETALRWRLPHWKFNQIVTNIGIDFPF